MNKKILICGGTGCLSSKSREIKENLEKELKNRNIDDVEVVLTGCFGFCEKGPIVKVVPANNFYIEVKPEDAKDIIEIDIIDNKKVERILYKDPVSQKAVTDYKKMNFYQKQERRVLKNCGTIDPENIDDFLKNDGYKASKKAISEMTREFVIKNIIDSGLRGRGGGGFPTGIKWEIASKNHAEQKYIVCNADEGDPGAFMDRSILEGDPHSVIEGMMIAGYAIGATKGLVYIRAEYPLAIERLEKAIESARERGYLGKNLFGTDFEFDIEIKFGAGAFVCGEETALIHSMEGKRGEPTSKPPYPAEKGFWDMPTVVNNVETLVNVPRIILNGVEWFTVIYATIKKETAMNDHRERNKAYESNRYGPERQDGKTDHAGGRAERRYGTCGRRGSEGKRLYRHGSWNGGYGRPGTGGSGDRRPGVRDRRL